ncbi:MAG: (2Fe-2S) ferredoxin domain-containing protein [Bacteroidia bacterium]|nr:(2Fe-2S) ferredoxin domain-containing protein [Bacteroidia bacterium]
MENLKFDKHVFICVNQRAEGEKRSCGEGHGMALVTAFKKTIKDKNLNIKVRAQRAGCLDVCHFGPTLVVYPEGIFYVGVELKDVEEIVESHIKNDIPVERLRLKKEHY